MGFRFKRIDLVGGSTDFPTGSSSNVYRSQIIVKKVAESLIDMGNGWALDTSRNATTSDYSSVPCLSGSNTFPALFLKNTLSGCKLFLAYFGGTNASNEVIADLGGHYTVYSTTVHSGLIVSIIPAGSSSEFGSSFNSSFLPSDATPIIGTVYYTTTSGGYTSSHAYNPTADYTYTWGIFATSEVIAVSSCYWNVSGHKANISTPVYAVGKIFGTLANPNESNTNSAYGIIAFRGACGGTIIEGWSGERAFGYTPFSGTSYAIPGINPNSATYAEASCCGCVSRLDGSWVNGTDGTSSYIVYLVTQSPELLSTYVCDISGGTFWTPMYMFVRSTDPVTYGVGNGSGVKGILDTELFRYARGTFASTFANGKFIMINEPQYCAFAIGWSPENTDSIEAS